MRRLAARGRPHTCSHSKGTPVLSLNPDFGPTLSAEKLGELDGIVVSRETIRGIQIDFGLALVQRRRAKQTYLSRKRWPPFGEPYQIDASPHDWFEGWLWRLAQ